MDISKLEAAAKQIQLERDVSAARITANAALLASKETNKKLDQVFRAGVASTMAKAQGGDPGELSRLRSQIRNLEAKLSALEQGQTRHTTRLDKHLTRSKAHGARIGHLESQVLEPMAKAAEAKERKVQAAQEKRLERFALESEREAILAKCEGLTDAGAVARAEVYLQYGQLEEARNVVTQAESIARELDEIRAEKTVRGV